jgi:hypothetical protein
VDALRLDDEIESALEEEIASLCKAAASLFPLSLRALAAPRLTVWRREFQ